MSSTTQGILDVSATPSLIEGDPQLLELSMGPQHPSTHGVFRMNVVLDGETVVKLKPVFGYLHRNHEKIAENETYLGSMPYTDRLAVERHVHAEDAMRGGVLRSHRDFKELAVIARVFGVWREIHGLERGCGHDWV